MNSKQRIQYLDMAKGTGIVLMVAGHMMGSLQTIDAKPWFSPLYQFIASFHMPLFFIISGILLYVTREEEKDMKTILSRKARSLLLPYFSFSLAYFVINLFTCIFRPTQLRFSDLWKFFFYSVTFRGVSVLWFLPALFLAETIFLWCRKKLDERDQTLLFAVAGLLICYLSPLLGWEGFGNESDLPLLAAGAAILTPVRGLFCCIFLLTGYRAARLITATEKKTVPGFLAGAAMLGAAGVLCFVNDPVDLNTMVFGNYLLYMICAHLGSFGVILLCKNMYQSRLLRFYGVNSLVIMATHMDFKVALHAIQISYWVNLFVTRAKAWVLYGTMAVLVTLAEAGLIYIFDHFLYFLIGKRRPGRGRREDRSGQERKEKEESVI